ncbi:hypothetical protein SNK03_003720 [Fusarium graminearum]
MLLVVSMLLELDRPFVVPVTVVGAKLVVTVGTEDVEEVELSTAEVLELVNLVNWLNALEALAKRRPGVIRMIR